MSEEVGLGLIFFGMVMTPILMLVMTVYLEKRDGIKLQRQEI